MLAVDLPLLPPSLQHQNPAQLLFQSLRQIVPPSKSPAAAASPLLLGQRKMSSGPSISADDYMALQKKVDLYGMLIVDCFSQIYCGVGVGMMISNTCNDRCVGGFFCHF